MKTYRFYGWETADVKDRDGLTPRDYYDILSDIWCAETCAPRMRDKWSADNPTLGQCSVTAFLLQDMFGGKVYGIRRPDGNYHCFNDVNGCVFDLTSEQFGGEVLDYTDCPEQLREIHFAKEEKRRRYEYLRAKVMEKKCALQ
ncbi:MAG: hypothetical protein II828_04360 [Clostridia bacterium]|nr:hypothetical protein [Clostridia bacterium]